jgi:hypothetical protein
MPKPVTNNPIMAIVLPLLPLPPLLITDILLLFVNHCIFV